MLNALILSLLGLILLVVAGEALVRGAVSLALNLNVSPLLVGLTLVSLGTSAPELFVAIDAVRAGAPAIALGAVIGSNIANILLVLGAMVALAPLTVPSELQREARLMPLLTAGFVIILLGGAVTRPLGAAMLAVLAAYLVYSFRHASDAPAQEAQENRLSGGVALAASILLLGLIGISLGADYLVRGATELARLGGVSEAVIGLSLVAIGTSLPELAVSLIAVRRGASAVALGNILGSNIANILLIIGTAALVKPISVAAEFVARDAIIMLLVALSILLVSRFRTVPRLIGVLYLTAYAAYMGLLFLVN